MSVTTYHGVVRSGVVLIDDGDSLAEGTEVLVTPMTKDKSNADEVLEVMAAEPHLTEDDIEELEKAIHAGQRPRSRVEPL